MKVCFAIIVSFVLVSCGGDQGSSGESSVDEATSDAVVEYKKKVSAKLSESMVNSFVRDFGITEDQARCLLSTITTSEMMRAETDPDVQARVRACDVDPAVLK